MLVPMAPVRSIQALISVHGLCNEHVTCSLSVHRRLTVAWDSCDGSPSVCVLWLAHSSRDTCRYTSRKPGAEEEGHADAEQPDCNGEFGFVTLDRPHTLKSFRSYAHWAKNLHFSNPAPKASPDPCGPA